MLRRLAALAALALVGCGGANLPPVELSDLAAPPAVDGAIDDGPPPPPTDLARGCSATSPRAVPVTLYALPEAGELPFVELLQRAQRSIRVMVYLMGRGGILDTLKAKAKAGVQVQVILDRQQSANTGYSKELQQAGAQVKLSDARFTYSHAKFFVVDETEATIATGNYSLSYLQKERNFVARDGDPADVADLVQLFDADWGGGPLDLACTRLLVSPINARQRLLELIRSATNTLAVESMQLADDEIRLALAERRRAGVAVRVLLADPSWITANRDAARDQLQLAQDRYRLGSGSALDVTDAQNNVQRAEGDYVNAVYDYHKAIAALELAVGRSLR